MAEPSNNAKVDKKRVRTEARGTQDELEVLALVIAENPGLRVRVLEKLRAVRSRTRNSTAANVQEKADNGNDR